MDSIIDQRNSNQPNGSYPPFNYVLGTQTFLPKYQFTEDTRLVETAKKIQAMGSNTIKLLLGVGAINDYKLPPNQQVNSYTTLLDKEPSFRQVLRMPFNYYLFWVQPSPIKEGKWQDYYDWSQGYSETERFDEYQQMYDLTCYLLTTFNNSGKTFLLGNWEGDWAVMGAPYDRNKEIPQKAFDGMIQRMNNRQLAVDNAKMDTSHKNVHVYHYMEVVLVEDTIQRGKNTLTNCVLPYVNVDYVSFSCYSSLGDYWDDSIPFDVRKQHLKAKLKMALDFIDGHIPETNKSLPWEKRVFIGEYGFRRFHRGTQKILLSAEEQAGLMQTAAATALSWGCPFVLYWQMYDNECEEGGADPSGFAMIDSNGRKQPLYYVHKKYYEHAYKYVSSYRRTMHRNPTHIEFRKEAVKWFNQD